MIDQLNKSHLTILQPGFHTLVVDQGRPSTRSQGISIGGAADRWSLAVGNALVGNRTNSPGLEINLGGPTLIGNCRIAAVVFGADIEMSTDRRAIKMGRTFTLECGEVLELGSVREGVRAYFCVQGGLQVPLILGSHSSLRPLRRQDQISCFPGSIQSRFLVPDRREISNRFGIVWGSHADRFDQKAILDQSWEISRMSNRMGSRLIGQPLNNSKLELESEPVCPGTIQVTPDGQCIILGVDGQTIGGYPRIAHVIRADMDRIGQMMPGQRICFEAVSLEEAEIRYQKQRQGLQWLLNRIELGSIWS